MLSSRDSCRWTYYFKKGGKLYSPNYRTISLTPSFAKVFELLLLTQMANFLDQRKLLIKNNLDFGTKSPQIMQFYN